MSVAGMRGMQLLVVNKANLHVVLALHLQHQWVTSQCTGVSILLTTHVSCIVHRLLLNNKHRPTSSLN